MFAGGRKAFGFALVPDDDRRAGCFLHSSRRAINLAVPASLETPALRLRRGKRGRMLNSQLFKHFSEFIMLCRLLFIPSLKFLVRGATLDWNLFIFFHIRGWKPAHLKRKSNQHSNVTLHLALQRTLQSISFS